MVRIQAFLVAAVASLALQAQGSLEARLSTLEGAEDSPAKLLLNRR